MTVPAETLTPLPSDADIASAAALIADSDPRRDLRALLRRTVRWRRGNWPGWPA